MNRTIVVIGFIALCALPGFAQKNPFVLYTEGPAQVQNAAGQRRAAQIGDPLLVNETVITGKAGRVQLKTADSVIDVFEKTVFKLLEAQKNGQKQNAYLCALGSIKVKVNKIAGGDPGPRIGTTSAAAGVRGTELDVYAGEDGSSLVLVAEGVVDVESQGKTVALNPNEAVEVKPGQAPGAIIYFKKPIDYGVWNQAKLDDFEKDPVAAITAVEGQLKDYIGHINTLWDEYKKYWLDYEEKNEIRKKIEKSEGTEAGQKYATENIKPVVDQFFARASEIRFDALSALSLRRFVAGRMYLMIKSRYINNQDDKTYSAFMAIYQRTISFFNDQLLIEKTNGIIDPRTIRFIEEGNI